MKWIELKHRSGIPIRIKAEEIITIYPEIVWIDNKKVLYSTVATHSHEYSTCEHPDEIWKKLNDLKLVRFTI